jgi:polar amino acid transport system substrate-binding protein
MPLPHAAFLSRAAKSAAAVLLAAFSASGASAQITDRVDSSLLESWRLSTGNLIRFCQYESSPTFEFDQAVGQAIADSLLVSAEFTPLGDAYGIGGEYAIEDLFVSLTNDCDIMLGMGLAAGLYPVEFTTTRAYVGLPYVLAVADPEFEALTDIPGDRRIGALVGSYGFSALMRYRATLPADQRWQPLPYGDTDLMMTRMFDETIAGMVVYGPSLVEYLNENSIEGEIFVHPLEAQIAANVNIGGIMLARNSYLRTLVDEAIGFMAEDGTIEALLAEHGYETLAAAPGGYR